MLNMNSRYRTMLALVALVCLVSCTGCVGAIAQVMYMWKGITLPAEYNGLKEKRVAVVCVSSEDSFGPSTTAARLARTVGKLIQINAEEVNLIRANEVADWIDKHNWDEVDYLEIGRGVNAEMVVAIDLRDYRLREGATLLQGRASATITVYDITRGGEEVFKSHIDDYHFPRNGYPTTEMSESRFDRIYLGVLAKEVARKFYEHDAVGEYARDPATLSY